ncbi:tachykinin-3 isoform X2 [Emydura macquarii macquarii]|uniref:tachykinin-3 isoform X2 n=1 Tax=Emydura macquarii macquarii TaxID=1129001 RepID=UPI00352B1A27
MSPRCGAKEPQSSAVTPRPCTWERKMKSSLVLTVMLSLAAVKLCHAYCEGNQEQQTVRGTQTKPSSDLYQLPPVLLRRLYEGHRASYEALLRLLGKDDARSKVLVPAQKRDMHDFFVGLMGKRTPEPDDPTEGNQETFASLGDPKHSPNAE